MKLLGAGVMESQCIEAATVLQCSEESEVVRCFAFLCEVELYLLPGVAGPIFTLIVLQLLVTINSNTSIV